MDVRAMLRGSFSVGHARTGGQAFALCRTPAVALATLVSVACGDAPPPESGFTEPTEPTGQAEVRIGVPDEITGLDFVPLETDGPISLRSGGQGGTHAIVALQITGLGDVLNFVVTIRELEGSGKVSSTPLPRPRPVRCNDGVCEVVPIFVVIGGLAEPEQWDGMEVELSAKVTNDSGASKTGMARGLLRRD